MYRKEAQRHPLLNLQVAQYQAYKEMMPYSVKEIRAASANEIDACLHAMMTPSGGKYCIFRRHCLMACNTMSPPVLMQRVCGEALGTQLL